MIKRRGKISSAIRAIILERLGNGEKQNVIAKEFKVNPSTICVLRKQYGTPRPPAEQKHTCQASPATMQVARSIGATERQDIAAATREVATALRSMVEEMKISRRGNAR
jgi:hypothetical protein